MRPSGRRWWAVLTDVGLVALLVMLGLATTLGAYRALAQKADAQQRELLNAMGQSVVGAFDLQLVRVVEALQVSSQLFSAQGLPTREQFARFGAALLAESSTLALLEWQPLVPRAELAEFERRAAREQPGYRVVEPAAGAQGDGFAPAGPREVHVPVL